MYDLQGWFSALWVVWFFLLFGGVLFWILRPSKRAAWRERGSMIFRDDEMGGR